MLPDADGLDLLDPTKLKASWEENVGRIENHYKFTDDQKAKAKALLEQGEPGPTSGSTPTTTEKPARSTSTS